jgi:hypothetical protein
VIARRHHFLDPAVEILVLEEEDAVVVAAPRFDQPLGVARGGGVDDLEPGRVQKRRLGFCEWNGPPRT